MIMMTKVAFAVFVASVSAITVDDATELSEKLDGMMERIKEMKTEMSHADDMDDDVDDMDNDVDEMSACVASKPYRGGNLPCAPYFGTSKILKPRCSGLSASECPQSYARQKKDKFVRGQQKCKDDIFICRWSAKKDKCGGTRFAKEQCPAPPTPPATCPTSVVYTSPFTCANHTGGSEEYGSYIGRGSYSCQCLASHTCLAKGGYDIAKANAAFGTTLFQMHYDRHYQYTLGAYPPGKCPELASRINEVLNPPESADFMYTPVTCSGDELIIAAPYCSYTMSMFNAKIVALD